MFARKPVESSRRLVFRGLRRCSSSCRCPKFQKEERNDATSQHREVAAALMIDTRGRFLLQQRDNIPGILFPGKIGLFGGPREGDETFPRVRGQGSP
jgi:hypothetical protein